MQIPGVSYAAAGVAGAALALSGLSAISAAGHPGAHSSSPGFGDVMGWFHTMATNGMLSVNYPTVYRSFSKNFGFSTGLIPWGQMQQSIDNFRQSTGGNLTQASYEFLRNATLDYSDGSSNSSSKTKRGWNMVVGAVELAARDLTTSYDSSTSGNDTSDTTSEFKKTVSGIEAFAAQLTVPQANIFRTGLLIFAIVVSASAVGILLVKVILELWALYVSFPKRLPDFRQDY